MILKREWSCDVFGQCLLPGDSFESCFVDVAKIRLFLCETSRWKHGRTEEEVRGKGGYDASCVEFLKGDETVISVCCSQKYLPVDLYLPHMKVRGSKCGGKGAHMWVEGRANAFSLGRNFTSVATGPR